ncbi:helix-turn-helix domain-containing protein [Natrialba asiatica]|uniref:Bacterio-opsin activator HTH domain-containing protein n=1 Tax=Natrialba asiatica (strain ATCC 700177 / DSM 12278 / JCM 9576 / FERM P-10747 / NBRC 102637 / 172P1) TaxID=29540 RepID=M0B6L5_NATA1|nr:helix-turn-helix domain-containing protein [Natrialba asiatica]ELZ05294.1 bacterio-opsin activator HTH domain-containing protein [Natrialba asiatica DSM 12278]
MQEFVFTVTYDSGADDLMDVFIEYSELYARTIACHATTETMWRVDDVTGSRDALAAYDQRLTGLSRCSNLRGMGGSRIDWTHEVLSTEPTRRVIYSRQSEGDGCRSIPYLAAKYLGDGALCRAEQHGATYEWRLLAADETAMSPIYDELSDHLRDGLELTFERVESTPNWEANAIAGSELPHKQREALELGVEYGYYQTPRRSSVQDIAAAEGIPVSTLQYRLTRAEAWLATTFLSNDPVERGQQQTPRE